MDERENMPVQGEEQQPIETFDEAAARARAIFEGEPEGEPEVTPEGNDGGEAPEEAPADVPADVPAATPAEQPMQNPINEQIMQLQQQLMESQQRQDAIMQQNAQLQSMVNELSNANKEKMVEDTIEMPVLNIGGLAFEDEDAQRDAQIKYAQDMQNYVMSSVMKQLDPYIQEAKRGERAREEQAWVDKSLQYPEMADLNEVMPAMRDLMDRAPIFKGGDVSTNERLMTAYIMQKGIDAITHPAEQPKEPTVEDLMGIYESNPDFRAAIEQKRIAAVKDGMQVPPLSASSGAANAALQIKDAPKSFEEAYEITRELFKR